MTTWTISDARNAKWVRDALTAKFGNHQFTLVSDDIERDILDAFSHLENVECDGFTDEMRFFFTLRGRRYFLINVQAED